MRVSGLELRVLGLGCRFLDCGFEATCAQHLPDALLHLVHDSGLDDWVSGFGSWVFRFEVLGLGFWGLGDRV